MKGGEENDPESIGSDGVDPILADLAAKLAERIRRGERPDIVALTREHPGYTDDLRRMAPAIAHMAELGRRAARQLCTESGKPSEDVPGELELPCNLGDFRLLREIG